MKIGVYRQSAVALLSFAFMIVCLTTYALSENSDTGLPPFGSFGGSGLDLVSLENGNLHIEIPMASFPQRNIQNLTYNYVYDIAGWEITQSPVTPTTYQWDVSPSPDQNGFHLLTTPMGAWHVDHDIVAKTCTYTVGGVVHTANYNVHTNYVVTDTHGTKHPFEVRHVDQPGSGCQAPTGNQNTGWAWMAAESRSRSARTGTTRRSLCPTTTVR